MDAQNSSTTNLDAAAVAAMVATYRSKVLSEEQALRWLPRLKELVVASEPCSTKKATLYLTAGCRFLADMSETGEESVDGLLCDATVARWSHRFGSQGRTDSTLGNYLGSLNRLVDTKKGLPTQRRTPSTGPTGLAAPLSVEQVAEIFSAALAIDPAVAAACVVGVGANRPGRAGVGAVVNAAGLTVSADSGLTELWMVDAIVPLAGQVAGVTVEKNCWVALRSIAAEHGVLDLTDVARATHRVLALGEERALVDAVRRHRLGYDSIDSARPHLAKPGPSAVGRLLRGPA
jgi:hypothetical protein